MSAVLQSLGRCAFKTSNFQSVHHVSKAMITEIITKRINKNFELRTLEPIPVATSNKPRPIVILFAWLQSKKKHVKKYSDYYLGRGFDVLNVRIEPIEVLQPKKAQGVVHQVLDYVREDRLKTQPILAHGFSVGGYLYGEFLVKLVSEGNQHQDVKDRMIGQIFDSPVDFEGIPNGLSKVLTKNPLLRKLIYTSLDTLLKTFTARTAPYLRAAEAFKSNDLQLPTLLLYSEADPICNISKIESVVSMWKLRDDFKVTTKCWKDSTHVSHMFKYHDDYVDTVDKFLRSIGIPADKPSQEVMKALLKPLEIHEASRKTVG